MNVQASEANPAENRGLHCGRPIARIIPTAPCLLATTTPLNRIDLSQSPQVRSAHRGSRREWGQAFRHGGGRLRDARGAGAGSPAFGYPVPWVPTSLRNYPPGYLPASGLVTQRAARRGAVTHPPAKD